MKNKKILIIAIFVIIVIAIIIGINITNKKVGDFLFSTDGTNQTNTIQEKSK